MVVRKVREKKIVHSHFEQLRFDQVFGSVEHQVALEGALGDFNNWNPRRNKPVKKMKQC